MLSFVYLGEQPGGADGPGAGQRGEGVRVSVQRELLGDLGLQSLDLGDQAGQDGQQGAGDVGLGGAVVAGGPGWRGGQAGVQGGGVFAAAVADAGQPGGQPPGREPGGPVLAVEAGQERQADGRVEVAEQADGAGEAALQVGAELVAGRDRWVKVGGEWAGEVGVW